MRFGFDEKHRAIFSERHMINVAATRIYIMPHDAVWRKPIQQHANFFFRVRAFVGAPFTVMKFIHHSE